MSGGEPDRHLLLAQVREVADLVELDQPTLAEDGHPAACLLP